MRDIVLIPTYVRPEYLYLCLEHIANAQATNVPKEFWVCADRRPHDEHRQQIVLGWQKDVLSAWVGKLPLRFIHGREHSYNGNSFNVLESYKKAHTEVGVRYIYLVEDDVMVTPDFFKWHEAVAEVEPAAMCSIAYRCSRNHEARTDITDPGAYFTSAKDYASIGVRWQHEALVPVLAHANALYYGNQEGYVRTTFPDSKLEGYFAEQDGIIMRVMADTRGYSVWPYVPRCYHMGLYGYNRPNGKRPDGFLEQKIDALRGMFRHADKLKIAGPDYGDVEPMPTIWPEDFTELKKLQHFKREE